MPAVPPSAKGGPEPPLTPEDRAWGLPGRDEYSAVFARTLERDVRPRLARLDLALD